MVGCGRYVGGHANKYVYVQSIERCLLPGLCVCSHFVETQHTFAMHLDTGRVWDYAGGKLGVDVCVPV